MDDMIVYMVHLNPIYFSLTMEDELSETSYSNYFGDQG